MNLNLCLHVNVLLYAFMRAIFCMDDCEYVCACVYFSVHAFMHDGIFYGLL